MITLEYRSNNSGGSWWLDDAAWRRLEAAGWAVEWLEKRWLGALATSARKVVETPQEGVADWQAAVGLDPWDEGCNCCGEPHNFSYEGADGRTHAPHVQRNGSVCTGWE